MPDERKTRGKYLGFVAHEMKNPLATALWSIDLLKRMEGEDRRGPKAERIVDASLRSLRRLRRLVDDFFTIERLREGGLELRSERLRLHDLVAAAMSQLAEKEGIPSDRFFPDLPADLSIDGDAELLRRGLRGALETIARAYPQARIALSARRLTDGRAALLVHGEGLGRPLVPPPPHEREAGDQAGAILSFALCESIFGAHGGALEEKEEGLFLLLPGGA